MKSIKANKSYNEKYRQVEELIKQVRDAFNRKARSPSVTQMGIRSDRELQPSTPSQKGLRHPDFISKAEHEKLLYLHGVEVQKKTEERIKADVKKAFKNFDDSWEDKGYGDVKSLKRELGIEEDA